MKKSLWYILILFVFSTGTASAASKPVSVGVTNIRNGKSAVLHFVYLPFKNDRVGVTAYSSWTITPAGKRTPKTKSRNMWLERHTHTDTANVKLDANGNGSVRLDGMPRDKMVSVWVVLKQKFPGGKTSDSSRKLRFSME